MYYIQIKKIIKPLTSLDWFSKNDLFVLIKYGNQIRRTSVLWDNNNPEWNEAFIFDVKPDIDKISLSIYDEDSWSKSEKIAEEEIDANLDIIKEINTNYLVITHGLILKRQEDQLTELFKINDLLSSELLTRKSLIETLREENKNHRIHNNNLEIKIKSLMKKLESIRELTYN